MEAWLIWIIVALVFFIVEMLTAGVAVICFSAGALVAAAVSGFTDDWTWQIVSFAAGTILAFIFLRPVLLRWFSGKRRDEPTNTDAMIGRMVKVVEKIDSEARTGRITIDGVTWQAVASDGKTTYEVDQIVIIKEINSIVLTVV